MPTAVITGSGSGIGRAFAGIILREKYDVYALDVNGTNAAMLYLAKEGAHTAELNRSRTYLIMILDIKEWLIQKDCNTRDTSRCRRTLRKSYIYSILQVVLVQLERFRARASFV